MAQEYRNPATTADALVVRKNTVSSTYELLAIQRGGSPFQGFWALPGGFIEYGEDPEDAVRRELFEETGLRGGEVCLIAVRGAGMRDPRQHVITIAYCVKVDPETLANCSAGDDAKNAQWLPLEKAGSEEFPLAFDHSLIVETFRKWFLREGEKAGFYANDLNPTQPIVR